MTFIESLMLFNFRVLDKGKVIHGHKYSLKELKDKAFFNKIYLDNSKEMLMKYPIEVKSISDLYDKGYMSYLDNIRNIKKCLESYYDISIINEILSANDILNLIDSMTEDDHKSIQNTQDVKFSEIFKKDMLIEYPIDSFNSYLNLLSKSSKSKLVESISITLYRIGNSDSLYNILEEAINNRIKVNINIELFASGDEANNLEWMRKFESIGANITTYGGKDIKVHAKLTLIKFKNKKRIAQIGTGNYHTETTKQYTDLSLVTSDEDICFQVEKIFNILKGNECNKFNKSNFLVSRYNFREEFYNLINREIEKGNDGYIGIKCNTLSDSEIESLLTKAAKSGCEINAVIRGVCTWNPGFKFNGFIKSIIWNKLEHSRVYCFGKVNPKIYIGSLDLIKGKIENRIEVLVKVNDPDIISRICSYMNRYIINIEDSWIMQPDGNYIKENRRK